MKPTPKQVVDLWCEVTDLSRMVSNCERLWNSGMKSKRYDNWEYLQKIRNAYQQSIRKYNDALEAHCGS